MHLKPARIAARTAAIGGVLVLGLGGTVTAAMASPVSWQVPCNTGALYYAINEVSSGGTLTLASDCTYYLAESLVDTKDHLTIIGNGATLQGGGPYSGFAILGVSSMDTLTLDGVSFNGGYGDDGGAISNKGYLTVNGGVFSYNSAGYGGAIDSGGKDSSLTIKHAVFTHNSAIRWGGAVATSSTTAITGTTFADNKGHDGGALYNDADPAAVGNTSFIGNVGEYGGAIYNTADLALGTVTGRAGGDTFSENKAYEGGAIYNHDSATIDDSLIMSNEAHRGGGLYNDCAGGYTLSGTTFRKNVTGNIYVRRC